MATQYNIYSYIKGINGFGLAASDTNYSVLLTADTDTELETHILSSHADQQLKDEEAEAKRPRGRPKTVAV